MELWCETSSAEQVNVFPEVAYVLDVVDNLFLVKKATAVGAEVVCDVEICAVSIDGEEFGHAVYASLTSKVEGSQLTRGVVVKAEALRAEKTSVCESCIMAKQTPERFLKESDSRKSTEPFGLVHMDVCEPSR
ncbi:hypothetical protein KFL_004610010 [Klebsormidium nitens]|uniref:Uncharacterized protein n=1 Tax=Klebsormidium nitens TaxID=105231 RepID=A0A1Y1IJB3_KLENI|nr:hypothetical protein KFL_004610010 [Klebsormidium nitens]|eukprot:GAQ88806.1 hypothetical protein KFL_004610010 [Klebsormidium nitens]